MNGHSKHCTTSNGVIKIIDRGALKFASKQVVLPSRLIRD